MGWTLPLSPDGHPNGVLRLAAETLTRNRFVGSLWPNPIEPLPARR